jgi:hypothetical protein
MKLDLNEEQSRVLEKALSAYLSELRGEIAKTEKHEWRVALHREEEVLNGILSELAVRA